jgi:Protein of unknown function (DUF2946)
MHPVRTSRASIWLLTLSLLFAAFAPLLSHAVRASATGSGWVEICTAAGSKWVQAEAATSSQPGAEPDALHVLEHCPYCSVQAHLPALLPGPAPTFATSTPGSAAHSLQPSHLPGRPVWALASPRGPPSRA